MPKYTNEQRRDLLNVLHHAREIIKQGWCRHQLRTTTLSGKSQFCAIGACMEGSKQATGHLGGYSKAVLELGETIGVDHIPSWNDERGRRKEEVVAAFDETISRVERG